MNQMLTRNKLPFVIALGLLFGCASTEPSRLYVLAPPSLQPAPAASQATAERLTVHLDRVSLPSHLHRPLIITQRADTELAFSEFHRWGEPLDKHLTDIIALHLGTILPNADIVTTRASHNMKAALNLQVEMLRLTGELGREAEIAARWSITDSKTSTASLHTAVYREPLTTSDHAAYVAALSHLMANLSAEIAASLK